jgi:hypothetical protein
MRRVLCIAVLLIAPRIGHGQATPLVPPSETVYRDIDRLAALGLMDTLVVGARPFSEHEVLRLLREAQRNIPRNPSAQAWATETIRRDVARLARVAPRPLDGMRLDVVQMDSPYRPVPDNPSGIIDAPINPLSANRGGRALTDGFEAAVETRHSVTVTPFLALSLTPRFVLSRPRSRATNGATTEATATLQAASANFLMRNVSLEVGRDYNLYGPSPTGGLLLSSNAPAFDMVRLTNDAPFTLPWVFRVFGPVRASLSVADLGGSHEVHPHAQLASYHVAVLPRPHLELGFEVLDAMGGKGGQPASFGDRVLDAIPVVDVFRSNSDFQFSNKMVAADFHWRVPQWRGFELYGQTAVDDFDARRLRSVFLEDGGYLAGVAFSCISECGRLGVRAEYRQTGIRFYTHPDYPLASRGVLLGDPLGPRGLGGYVSIDHETRAGVEMALSAAFEVRSGNKYSGGGGITAGDGGFHFVQFEHHPGEKRSRLAWTGSVPAGHNGLELQGGVAAERVTNFAFVAGSDRLNWLASMSMAYHP